MQAPEVEHFLGRQISVAANGLWESPPFPVTPFAYYRVSFAVNTSAGGMWAVFFADAEGQPMVADNYFEVDAAEECVRYDYCVRANFPAAAARLRFHAPAGAPLEVDDIAATAITPAEGAKMLEETIAGMPHFPYEPPEDRLRCLPNTVKTLREGGAFRIVMLGDSIVNDVSNSLFELLLARAYPKADIRVITSVLSSKGCEHYRQPDNLHAHVLAFAPDLLIIGGISTRDVESIRDVVRQVRAVLPAEVMLMTPVLKLHEDPETGKPWTLEIDPAGAGMRSQQWRLAKEEHLAFADLAGPFTQYALSPGISYNRLKRDSHHAGFRGKMVLAQIMARFLS